MLYRKRVEFAVGHGVSVHAVTLEGDSTIARRIETCVAPMFEAPDTISPDPTTIPGLAALPLDMKTLAELDTDRLVAELSSLPAAYGQWIVAQSERLADPRAGLAGHTPAVDETLAACRTRPGAHPRGHHLLASDPNAAEAFRFMNRAMWLQRTTSLFAERCAGASSRFDNDIDVPANRTWYPFQLAFILLNLPGLTELDHPDRSAGPRGDRRPALVPHRRRQDRGVPGPDGLHARPAPAARHGRRALGRGRRGRADALHAAPADPPAVPAGRGADLRLRVDPPQGAGERRHRWGRTPFRIGLWVGQRTTPNTTDDSAEAIQQRARGSHVGGSARRQSARPTS